MRRRWQLILPIFGLVLFGIITAASVHAGRKIHLSGNSRYFWWGAIRLDSDPLNQRQHTPTKSCDNGAENCGEWDPEYIWITPTIPEKLLIVTAMPAFVIGVLLMVACAKLGVDQVIAFMIAMPVFISLWFFLLGWLIDRQRFRRRIKAEQVNPI